MWAIIWEFSHAVEDYLKEKADLLILYLFHTPGYTFTVFVWSLLKIPVFY